MMVPDIQLYSAGTRSVFTIGIVYPRLWRGKDNRSHVTISEPCENQLERHVILKVRNSQAPIYQNI